MTQKKEGIEDNEKVQELLGKLKQAAPELCSELESYLDSLAAERAELIRAKERAEESDLMKSSFFANMSHDIRKQINTIIGYNDLLADEDLTQTEREEFIEMIDKCGQDLVSLIDNIIDSSKIETGELALKIQQCQLGTLMNDIFENFKNNQRLSDDGLGLQFDFPSKYADLKLCTDTFRFKQVFTYLISNSLKFTEKGYVRFGVSRAWGKTVEFYVQDTGMGIPESELHTIFTSYSKYAGDYNDTGLGLSICKNIVEMLGGKIHLVSVFGKGSTFYFTHPLECEVPEEFKNLREVKSLFDWKSRKMVIVSNIEQDKKFLKHVLANTGIEFIWFKTGAEALEYFEAGNVADIVLIEMSSSNLDATRRIHRASPAPIIAMSADSKNDEDRILVRRSGCIELIAKPLPPSTLLMTIDKILK